MGEGTQPSLPQWGSWDGWEPWPGSRDGEVGANARGLSEEASQHLVAESMQESREIYNATTIPGRADWVGGAIM